MTYYYAALQSKSHAFLFERRMKMEGVDCELAFMPREIMRDLCNLGVKFEEDNFYSAIQVIRHAGLPACKVYRETVHPNHSEYLEINY